MEKKIRLEEDKILRLEIVTSDDKSTNNYLEFDLEDIELPLRYQELVDRDKKNRANLSNKMFLINKKQDVDDGNILSRNDKEKLEAVQEFLKEEVKIYNLFLGENGVEKLLNGRKLGWTSLREIDAIIEEQILPHLDLRMESINEKIKKKYSSSSEEEVEVLE